LKSFNKHITNALQAILVVDCEKQILNYNNYAMYVVYKFFNKDLKSVKSISEIIDNEEILDETINHCKEGKAQKHFEYKIKTDEEDISFRITFISTEDLKSFIVLINEEDKNETQKLLSIISHDLISPITSIMGFSELLFQDLESKKKSNLISEHIFSKDEFEALNRIIKRTKLINTSTKEAYSLLENLLEWSRSKSNVINPNIEVLNITNIISSQVLFSKNQADFKNIAIEYEGKEEINVCADKNMLKTVLRNFISNAIKFTPRGGVIEITTSDILKDGKEKYLRIDVSDTGVGIPDKTLSSLFMQGQNITTKGTESEKGTGLGLKLCKEFAEKMNGNISIRSKRGKGTIASLSLPCA
jgi:signal transduction histidine kinase